MPPRSKWSRYANSFAMQDDDGKLVQVRRVPVRFVARRDNLVHVATSRDTLFGIAGRMYGDRFGIPGEQLAWVVAEFQPVPISDMTRRLEEGTLIYGPSDDYLRTKVFSPDARRRVE